MFASDKLPSVNNTDELTKKLQTMCVYVYHKFTGNLNPDLITRGLEVKALIDRNYCRCAPAERHKLTIVMIEDD